MDTIVNPNSPTVPARTTASESRDSAVSSGQQINNCICGTKPAIAGFGRSRPA
jgi:hypothetical protein